jgi:hypothetical protein
MGTATAPLGEELLDNQAGITEFGLPYNGWGGEKYIQKVKYKTKPWFRAVACRMSDTGTTGVNQISNDTDMVLLSQNNNVAAMPDRVKWVELNVLSNSNYFYSSKFKLINGNKTSTDICSKTVIFMNPNNGLDKSISVVPSYQLDRRTDVLNVTGAVSIGPSISGYGVALSQKLMYDLGIHEGEVVYFNFE